MLDFICALQLTHFWLCLCLNLSLIGVSLLGLGLSSLLKIEWFPSSHSALFHHKFAAKEGIRTSECVLHATTDTSINTMQSDGAHIFSLECFQEWCKSERRSAASVKWSNVFVPYCNARPQCATVLRQRWICSRGIYIYSKWQFHAIWNTSR